MKIRTLPIQVRYEKRFFFKGVLHKVQCILIDDIMTASTKLVAYIIDDRDNLVLINDKELGWISFKDLNQIIEDFCFETYDDLIIAKEAGII